MRPATRSEAGVTSGWPSDPWVDRLAAKLLEAEGPLLGPAVKVVKRSLPVVLARVVDRVVVHLIGHSEKNRRQAAGCLAEIGSPALPALILKFLRTESAAVQLKVVRVLRAIVPGLDGEQRFDLASDLMGLSRLSRDPDVARAVAEALAGIRRAYEAEG